jgi:hypothetical protein
MQNDTYTRVCKTEVANEKNNEKFRIHESSGINLIPFRSVFLFTKISFSFHGTKMKFFIFKKFISFTFRVFFGTKMKLIFPKNCISFSFRNENEKNK